MGIIESFFLIFFGAAVLASIALFARQPLIVAYIVVGCLFGPHGLGWATDASLIHEIGEIGIIFLLFLVGLNLPPTKLRNMVGESILTALGEPLVFFGIGFAVLYAFGFTLAEASVAGVAVMFSSTVLGVKLLPTTILHHLHKGEIVISLLLIQDVIAIIALVVLAAFETGEVSAMSLTMVFAAFPIVAGVAAAGVRYVVLPLLSRFDAYFEFVFLLAIGWCLGIASLAAYLGLSLEIGAFIAGVGLATSPIAQYIADSLRPLRDFFLILFFFSVGAAIKPELLLDVLLPTALLAILLVSVKPVAFRFLLGWQKEDPATGWEVGFRLGQASEFSILLAYAGASFMTEEASHVVQGATVLTLLLSTYLVIFRYPSPIALSEALRRD